MQILLLIGLTAACPAAYSKSTLRCEEQDKEPLPAGDLFKFTPDPSGATREEFCHFSSHTYVSGITPWDLWLTRKEEFSANFKQMASKMDFSKASADEANDMLVQRAAASLGMDTQANPEDWKIWVGTVAIQQADPHDPSVPGLFRPCWNSYNISNTECHWVPENESYPWIQNWKKNEAWIKPLCKGYPFTGKGWTYDWQGGPVGHNEFLVQGSKTGGTNVDWAPALTPFQFVCTLCGPGECGNFPTNACPQPQNTVFI